MKKYLVGAIIVLSVFLTGCGMTNDEIIRENNKCKGAGLKAQAYIDLNGYVREVRCELN